MRNIGEGDKWGPTLMGPNFHSSTLTRRPARTNQVYSRLEGLREIDYVLDCHDRGAPALPLHTVAELLYIKDEIERELLGGSFSNERDNTDEGRRVKHVTVTPLREDRNTVVHPVWTDEGAGDSILSSKEGGGIGMSGAVTPPPCIDPPHYLLHM